eukprot:15173944-Alexandrium_andersonii.AAC.1
MSLLERQYWESANTWRNQRGPDYVVVPKANASPPKAPTAKAPPAQAQAFNIATPPPSQYSTPVGTVEGPKAPPPGFEAPGIALAPG